MQKLILPTQHAPTEKVELNCLSFSSYKRVGIEDRSSTYYPNSICVETKTEDWEEISKWVAYHSLILNDSFLFNWYEEEHVKNPLKEAGECTTKDNYSDISNLINFRYKYPKPLNYVDLYNNFSKISDADYGLVKNYFNLFKSSRSTSFQRQISDSSYWDIVIAYSIIESIIGESPKCEHKLTCSAHGNLEIYHKIYSFHDWTSRRLKEIISNNEVELEYLNIIKEVYRYIRNPTVHRGEFPSVKYSFPGEGEIVFDLEKVKDNWKTDFTALLAIKIHVVEIARNLLIYKIFDLKIFNPIKPLHTFSIKVGK